MRIDIGLFAASLPAVLLFATVLLVASATNASACQNNLTPAASCQAEFRDAGGQTYLRVELENVQITSYQISAAGGDSHAPPTDQVRSDEGK